MSKPRYAQTDWSALAASAPLNKEAATVTSQNGEEGTFRRALNDRHLQKTPHAPRIDRSFLKRPDAEDFTGQRFSHFTVLGPAEERAGNQRKLYWSVRCDCGNFTLRTSKSLKKARGENPITIKCGECEYFDALREGRTRPLLDNSGRKREEVRADGTAKAKADSVTRQTRVVRDPLGLRAGRM